MPRQFYSHLNICKADAQNLYKCAAYGISENTYVKTIILHLLADTILREVSIKVIKRNFNYRQKILRNFFLHLNGKKQNRLLLKIK